MTRCTSTNALFLPYLTVDKQRLDLSSTPTSLYSFVLLRSRHQSPSLSTQHFNISAHINPSLPFIKVNSYPLLACSLIISCHQPRIIDDSYLSLLYSVLKLPLILPIFQQLQSRVSCDAAQKGRRLTSSTSTSFSLSLSSSHSHRTTIQSSIQSSFPP